MKPIRDIFRSYAVLDEQGRHVNGSDKQSNHNYGDAYESLFYYSDTHDSVSRNKVKLVMEVGVADGSCLLAWREIFPNAHIVGMDIHLAHRIVDHPVDRIEFQLGDQRLKNDCERVAAGRLFDMIIEDATHQMGNTLLTLYWLWPFVRPGGIYVVEEWQGASGDRDRIKALFPSVEIIGTCGPYIQDEPLVIFRKPL